MNKTIKRRIIISVILWALTLFWMGFIFGMSSENSEESGQTSGKVADTVASIFVKNYENMSETERENVRNQISHPIRKLAHFSEYAILGFLLFLSLTASASNKLKPVLRVLLTGVSGFIYGCTDEFHQGFVPGRAPSFSDVLIDFSGVVAGTVIALVITQLMIKRKL